MELSAGRGLRLLEKSEIAGGGGGGALCVWAVFIIKAPHFQALNRTTVRS